VLTGADIMMVKPALCYLDIVSALRASSTLVGAPDLAAATAVSHCDATARRALLGGSLLGAKSCTRATLHKWC